MKYFKLLFIAFAAFWFGISCSSVNDMGADLSFEKSYTSLKRDRKTTEYFYRREIDKGVNAYSLMALSRGLGGFISMYEATDSLEYLRQGFTLASEVIAKAIVVSEVPNNSSQFNDRYLGFVNINPKYNDHKRGGPDGREIPLFESYFYRYMAQLLYVSAKLPEFRNTTEYKELLSFLRTNGWEKWYVRGKAKGDCYPYLFRSRTHMTSHWAIVALYLSELETDAIRKSQYADFLQLYNAQLRSNLRETSDGAYVWNMTWDNPWPVGLHCNPASDVTIIQDGSHGNHVITYVVEAYELGKYWDDNDIKRFVKTANLVLFNSEKSFFYGDLNQKQDVSYAGGLRYGDGFLKLARYDKTLLKNFEKARISQKEVYHFRYEEFQYVAEFKLAQKYLSN